MKFSTTLSLALLTLGAASAAHAATTPRILPDHDVAVTYRAVVPGQQGGTYRVRYQASSQRAHATALSGEGAGLQFLLDIPAGSGDLIMPQTHTIVPLPNLSDIIHRVIAAKDAKFTKLGAATIAGHPCTKYLILSSKGDGTACLTKGGVPLAATAKDKRGSLTVTALNVADAPQPPNAFASPPGYATLNLPPSMLGQLLGR
jgi:hypothetical protein